MYPGEALERPRKFQKKKHHSSLRNVTQVLQVSNSVAPKLRRRNTIKHAFALMDVDNSGSIDVDEFIEVAKHIPLFNDTRAFQSNVNLNLKKSAGFSATSSKTAGISTLLSSADVC